MQSPEEVLVPEDLFKVLPAHPFAAGEALGGLEIHEGNLQPRIGRVFEDNHKRHRHQQQQVQLPMVAHVGQEALSLPRPGNNRHALLHGNPSSLSVKPTKNSFDLDWNLL